MPSSYRDMSVSSQEGDSSPQGEGASSSDQISDDQPGTEEGRSGSAAPLPTNDRVVASLLQEGVISREDIERLRHQAEESGDSGPLWRFVAQEGPVDADRVRRTAAEMYGFDAVDPEEAEPNWDFMRSTFSSFTEEEQEKLADLCVVPYEYELLSSPGVLELIFISSDPMNPRVKDVMRSLDVGRFGLKYAPTSFVDRLLEEAFPRRNEYLERLSEGEMARDVGTVVQEEDDQDLVDEEQLEAEVSSSTLINLFEATLVEGVRKGASDIHFFPRGGATEIHFRIDGALEKWHTEDRVNPVALLTIAKDNARGVDRFEREAGQDGHIQREIDDTLIRFRVSVLPLSSGQQSRDEESVVIRILDDRKIITDISELGLLPDSLKKFDKAIRQPHGMVILTGPTGSGKSTSLVAALHEVMRPEVNVLTVEDPVEYSIEGARQIKLSHKLKMEDALRSILRHDPDIVMVGEMRDRPTAELAMKLANTGHLTFSTLHTNDAPSAVSRLYKMGIEPFLIAYAINLVVAQRLVRRLCPECKRPNRDANAKMLEQLGFSDEQLQNTTIYQPGDQSQCATCDGRGYAGRRAIAEAMYFSDNIRHLIASSGEDIEEKALRETALEEGLRTLRGSARQVVLRGETSLEEMVRVTPAEE